MLYHRLGLRSEQIPETPSFPSPKGASGPKAACAGRFCNLAGVVEGAGMESAMTQQIRMIQMFYPKWFEKCPVSTPQNPQPHQKKDKTIKLFGFCSSNLLCRFWGRSKVSVSVSYADLVGVCLSGWWLSHLSPEKWKSIKIIIPWQETIFRPCVIGGFDWSFHPFVPYAVWPAWLMYMTLTGAILEP